MTKWVAGVVAAGLMAGAGAAPVPKDRAKPPLYFPTEVGAEWVYDVDGREEVVVVTAVTRKPDGAVVTTSRREGGRDAHFQTVEVGPGGLTLLEEHGRRLSSAWAMLRTPCVAETTWEVETRHPTFTVRGRSTAHGEDRVRVRAGSYTAVRVDTVVVLPNGATPTGVAWYVPEVGLVKLVTDKKFVRELKSFKPGKPAP